MAKKKKSSELDNQVDNAYYKYFDCVQVNMLSIPSISKDIKNVILNVPQEQQDAEMKKLVEKWQV